MNPTPWSQGIVLRWAPSVAFLENRFTILRRLGDVGMVRQFLVDDDQSIAMRVSKSRALRVAVDHLSFEDALGDFGDDEPSRLVLQLVLDHVHPGMRSVQWSLQYLVALETSDSAAEACRNAARAIHGDLGDALGLTDFASLVDGTVEGLGAYKMEFGVLTADEAPLRLSRLIGRSIVAPVDRELGLEVNSRRGFPSVALFVDLAWEVRITDTDNRQHLVEWLWAAQLALVTESARLVSAIYDRVTTNGVVRELA